MTNLKRKNLVEQKEIMNSVNENPVVDFVRQTVEALYPQKKDAPVDELGVIFQEHYQTLNDSVEILNNILTQLSALAKQQPWVEELFVAIEKGEPLDDVVFNAENTQSVKEFPTQTFSQFLSEKKLSQEQYDNFVKLLVKLEGAVFNRDYSSELLDELCIFSNFEEYLATCYKNGVVDGRNQRIEEMIRETKNSDGLYGNSSQITQPPVQGYIEKILNGHLKTEF